MKRRVFASGTLVVLLFAPASGGADPVVMAPAPDPKTPTMVTTWGVPTVRATTPLGIKVTVVVNGKAVSKDVEVAGIEPWKDPPRNGRTIPDWYDARVAAMSAASRAKTEKIVAAINKAFEKEFKVIGEVATADHNTLGPPLQAYGGRQATLGRIFLPGVKPPTEVHPKTKEPVWKREDAPMLLIRDPFREAGDGAGFISPSPGRVGFQGIMAPADIAVAGVASGDDLYGEQSFVSFGILEEYVAEVRPTFGMTQDDIFRALESLLDHHGIPATFDYLLKELSLDRPIRDGQTLAWSNTDPGLEYLVAAMNPSNVPEPAALGLFAIGLLLVASRTRRRPRTIGDSAITRDQAMRC